MNKPLQLIRLIQPSIRYLRWFRQTWLSFLAAAVGLTVMVVCNTKKAIFPMPIVALLGIVFLIAQAGIQFYRNQYRLMSDPSVKER